MKPNKYFDVSGCNCPELNTVKISQADGLPQREIQLPEEMSDKQLAEILFPSAPK